jgi:hypothetical protein
MPEDRKPARLDFSEFKPRTAPAAVDPVTQHRAVTEAKKVGFDARANLMHIDGRTLRRKGKVQMNMKVTPAVQQELKLLIAEFQDADACLRHLMDLHRQSRP